MNQKLWVNFETKKFFKSFVENYVPVVNYHFEDVLFQNAAFSNWVIPIYVILKYKIEISNINNIMKE